MQTLKTPRPNTKGFGLIGTVLVVLVLTAITGTGMYIYHRNHKAKTTTSNSSSSSSSTTNKPAPKPTPTPVDPYAGWKTYTDTTYHYSFRYPAGWSLTTSSVQGVAASVRNPGNSVVVSYVNPLIKDNGVSTFYVADLQDVTSVPSLKIVGGAVTANDVPQYSVVDASRLTNYPLVVGQPAQFDVVPHFTDTKLTDSAQLTTYPVGGAPFTTTGQVQAWFVSADAKTSLLILESLTYQP